MLHLFFIVVFFMFLVPKEEQPETLPSLDENELKDMINQSIIDGFFDGDTTKIPKKTYFLK